MQMQRVPGLVWPSDLLRDGVGDDPRFWEDNPFLEAADFQPGNAITVTWFGDRPAFWVCEVLPDRALSVR
jgi:hypothetical protein